MTKRLLTKLIPEQQKAVLNWPYTNHIPVLECHSREKKVWLQGWQKLDLNNVDWEAKLRQGCYDNGIVIRLGRCLSDGKQQLYSFALDFDDWYAVEAWFDNDTLTLTKISLPKEGQKHAQIGECNASNGSNDTLRGYTKSYNKNIFSNRYVAFDFEWSQESSPLLAAAFVDSDGNTKALHISEYSGSANPEAEFIKMINQELLKYEFSIGWYSTGIARYHEDTQEYLDGVDSDLAVLHNRCAANDLDSIVDFNYAGIPYIRNQTHIDMYNVFGKPIVQTTIFKNAYRTLKLDEVSKVVLESTSHKHLESGVVGKYNGLTGKDLQSLNAEEQKKYVLRDAELVLRLSKHNNGEVLDAMKSISEITGLDFEKVCRTGISTWWTSIFDNMGYDEGLKPASSSLSFDRTDEKFLKYIGGLVLQPKKGTLP